MTTTALGVTTLTIRVTMAEPTGPLDLIRFARKLLDLSSLIYVSALSEQENRLIQVVSGDDPVVVLSPRAEDASRQLAASFEVGEVSYHSPLEIILYGVGTGAGLGGTYALYKTATKLLDLWDRVNLSRVRHSESKLQIDNNELKVEINGLIRESLGLPTTVRMNPETGGRVEPPQIAQAAQALIDITRLEIDGASPL
jgi:hypothetical protein